MTIMTGRKLDTLRAAAQREGQGPHSQEYIVGLKLQVYELQDKVEQLETQLAVWEKAEELGAHK